MPNKPDKRFVSVDLSFNIGPAGQRYVAMPDCKDGGSVFCDDTSSKPKCGGTSCESKSGWRPGPCGVGGTVVCDGRSFVGCQGVTLDRDRVFGGGLVDCVPGGSIICEGTTKGCGVAPYTCVGKSCTGNSATKELGFEGRVMLDPGEFDALRAELAEVISKFAR